MTTASRSAALMRHRGYDATVVECVRGGVRHDLYGIGDALAIRPDGRKVLIQAYEDGKRERADHEHMDRYHPMVRKWCLDGSEFHHHRWRRTVRKGRVRWVVEEERVKV